jgi:hypothetical protein
MKKILFTLFFCGLSYIAYSQSPVIVAGMPSPNVASLGVINEVPVSLYTGRCDITVPLCELKEGDITVPVYLSYNSSGVKPDVHPGWVGQNWSLQAGGMITRTIKGIPDETHWKETVTGNYGVQFNLEGADGYLYGYGQNNINDWSSNSNVLNKAKAAHWTDTEPDQFTFNINGITGNFYIGEDGKIYCQSSPDIKIELGGLCQINYPNYAIHNNTRIESEYSNFLDYKISGFKITLSDGIQYEFGYYSVNPSDSLFLIESSLNFFSQFYYPENWNTWLLHKITSPNGYGVTFHYTPGQSQINNATYNHPVASFYITTSFERTGGNAYGLFGQFGALGANTVNRSVKYDGDIIFPIYLDSIVTQTQKMDFSISQTQELSYDYSSIVSDLQSQVLYSYNGALLCIPGRSKIGRYFYKNPYYTLAGYMYYNGFDYAPQRPELYESLVFWYNNAHEIYSYVDKLLYNDDNPLFLNAGYTPPIVQEGIDIDRFQWFKLDQIALYSKVESKYLKKWSFGYNNQSNERLMLLSLQEIGEKEEENNPYTFEYEDYYGSGKYSGTYKLPAYNSFLLDHWGYYNNTNSYLNDFTANDLNGYYNKRNANATYLYSGQLNKINYPLGGSVEFTYEPNQFSKTIKRNTTTGNFEQQNHSSPITGGGLRIKKIRYIDGNSVKLEKDYVYSEGILGHEIKYYWPNYKGKLLSNPDATYTRERFVSQNLLPLCGGLDYSVSYPKVEEVISGLGKTEYYYSNHLTNGDENFITTIDAEKSISSPYSPKDFERGKLLRKITKNANEIIVKKENYSYSQNSNALKTFIPAVSTKQIRVFDGWAIEGASYKIHIYPYNQVCSIDTVYDENGSNPVVNKADYSYNSYNLLFETALLRSDAKTQTTRLVYPFEIQAGADAVALQKMTEKNILNPYVEKIVYLSNNSLIDGEYRKYDEVKPGIFKPKQISLLRIKTPVPYNTLPTSIINNEYLKPEAYYQYNTRGNIVEVNPANESPSTVYLWSYNYQYPIVKIENATYEQVKNSLGENFIEKLSAKLYPDWTDNQKLTELPSNLPNAQITTYNYKHLIGILSKTDPRNFSTYYDYDAFGRLKETYYDEDNDYRKKRMIETHDYHYKNSSSGDKK